LIAAMLTAGGVVSWELRLNAIASARQEMNSIGVVLAEQTARTVQSVDLVLQEMQALLAREQVETPAQFRAAGGGATMTGMLARRLENLPQAEAIVLFDADGKLLSWSRPEPVPPLDISDRRYFRRLRDRTGDGVEISDAIHGRITGHWLMFVARRVSAADGSFLGVVAGLIDTAYLEAFYRTITTLPGKTVTLLGSDGTIIAGQHDIELRRGLRIPPHGAWHMVVAEGGGAFRTDLAMLGGATIATVHPLADYPLVVDADIAEAAVLAGWRKQAFGIALATGIAALGCTGFIAVIVTQFRRQRAQNVRLQASLAAQRKTEARLKAFAEMSADWFWEQNADLRFVIDSKIPLVSLPSDVGSTRWEFADPAMDPARWEAHQADLAARRPFRDFRWERMQTDGKRRYMSTSGDPIFDAAGNFTGYHGTGRDVTAEVAAAEAMRRAKEQAEAASRTKSEFLANMNHELRTPLNAILGFAELIRAEGPHSAARHADWAAEIIGSGRHLLDIINGVLELSRIEAGRYELAADRVDLAAVLRICHGMLRLQAEQQGVALACDVAAGPILRADSRAIKQIVLNLLANAIKFTHAGGTASTQVAALPGGDVAIVVSDTGIGIAREALASLGTPFTQADGSIRRSYGGTGLGLSISRKLAELHGGALTIESVAGAGTTVRVTLPAARVIAGVAAAA
jgi:signal transduction histidine kinase